MLSTLEGYHEYIGGGGGGGGDITSTLRDIMSTSGDIMSTLGDVQYIGGIPRCMWGIS